MVAAREWPAWALWPEDISGGLASNDSLMPPSPCPLPRPHGMLKRKAGAVRSQRGLWLCAEGSAGSQVRKPHPEGL